jgi:hypothetical protein
VHGAKAGPLLRERAAAAISAVHFANADPALALSYALWPSEPVRAAEAGTRSKRTSQ